MYHVSKFEDRHIMAISVPPSVHPDLPKDFQELSRIHFYLGRAPIDHILKSVEEASLETIDKGRIQIYFATKEIQEFLSSSWSNLDTFSDNSLEPSLYFQKSFNDLLKHTEEVLVQAYKKPTKKYNLTTIETMIGLTHEVDILSQELAKVGIVTNIDKIEDIKVQFSKLYNLKSHYENLSSLKEFPDYAIEAKKSLLEQLSTPYEFNYSELAKHICVDREDWMSTLHYLSEERKKIDQPDYVLNQQETQELKNQFVKQFKSFNSLLKNGVINYVHSFSASISKEVFNTVQKSLLSAESYFERSKNYHEEGIKRFLSRDYHQKELDKLNSIKEEFIQQKIDDKAFYEKYLTLLYRQEKNISQTFDKIRANLFNTNLKDTVTFEGDITTGFVVGTFSNSDKILLAHKDPFVDVPEAIYAMVIDKNKYDTLLKNNALVFDQQFRDGEFSNASNFWSYGQFLQEISDPYVQNFFLGQEFDLIDNTTLQLKDTKKKFRI